MWSNRAPVEGIEVGFGHFGEGAAILGMIRGGDHHLPNRLALLSRLDEPTANIPNPRSRFAPLGLASPSSAWPRSGACLCRGQLRSPSEPSGRGAPTPRRTRPDRSERRRASGLRPRHAHLCLVTTLLITAQLIDWCNPWSPESRPFREPPKRGKVSHCHNLDGVVPGVGIGHDATLVSCSNTQQQQ